MRLLAIAAAMAIGLLASNPAAEAASGKIKVAVVPCSCFAPYFIAVEKGYFTDKGLEIEPVQVTSGQDAISLVATGQIDALFGAISAGFFNALANGVELKVVASMGGESLQGESAAVPLLIRTDLVEQGAIKSLADLKGRKIGIPGGIGSISSYDLTIYMQAVGLTLDDVEVVNVPSPEMIVALKNGAIDAGITSSPFSTRIIEDGAAKTVTQSVAEIIGRDLYKTAVMVGPAFLSGNPEAAQAMVDALYRGNADLRGSGYGQQENLDILGRATKLEGAALTRDRFYFDDDLDPTAIDLASMQDAFIKMGVVSKPADLGAVIVDTLVNSAKGNM